MDSNFFNNIMSRIRHFKMRQKIYEEFSSIAIFLDSSEFYNLIDKLLAYPDGKEAIKSNWKTILNNLDDSSLVFSRLCHELEFQEEFLHEIPFLIDYGNIDDTGVIAQNISRFPKGKEAIQENFEGLLSYCFSHYDTIFCSLLDNPEGRALAKENFEIIRVEASLEEFFNFIDHIERLEEFKDEYKEYGFWAKLYKQIATANIQKLNLTYEQDESSLNFERARDLKIMSLMNSEDSEEKRTILERISQGEKFEFVSMGSTSLVVKTNNKIIKFGVGKTKFEIPYHPRIMMPYFRTKYHDGSFIEVYNMGDVKSTKVTDKELLKIYKELESAGILWGDARKENILELLEDNNLPHYIESQNFNVMGFLDDSRYPTTNHTPLKKGDLVICDLDYLYAKDDPNFKFGMPDPIILDYIKKKKRNLRSQDER